MPLSCHLDSYVLIHQHQVLLPLHQSQNHPLRHPIEVHHIAINRLAVLLRAVQVTLVQAVVTIINQILKTSHHIAVVQRKVQRQRRVHMTLMMMAMMISIWMTIMTMTDMTETAIMQMV